MQVERVTNAKITSQCESVKVVFQVVSFHTSIKGDEIKMPITIRYKAIIAKYNKVLLFKGYVDDNLG